MLARLQQFVRRLTDTPATGLDIGSHYIKAAAVVRTAQGISLLRAGYAQVQNADSESGIKELLQGFETQHVCVGLASPEVIVRPYSFPQMPQGELAGTLQLEAERSILNGHNINEVAVDWHPLPGSINGSLKGVLAVVPKKILRTRTQEVRRAGFVPAVVDVEGLALWNAYWSLLGHKQPSRTTLIVNVGVQHTTLVIVRGQNELMLIRDLEFGQALLQEGQTADWLSELQDSLAYARSNSGLRTLETAYLTGGGSTRELSEGLSSKFNVPCSIWNPLDQVTQKDNATPVDHAVGPLYTVAIGLGLRNPV